MAAIPGIDGGGGFDNDDAGGTARARAANETRGKKQRGRISRVQTILAGAESLCTLAASRFFHLFLSLSSLFANDGERNEDNASVSKREPAIVNIGRVSCTTLG